MVIWHHSKAQGKEEQQEMRLRRWADTRTWEDLSLLDLALDERGNTEGF